MVSECSTNTTNTTKEKVKIGKFILSYCFLVLSCSVSYAKSYENIDLNVGEVKTFYLPSEITSLHPHQVNFVACSPEYADIKSKTLTSVEIIGKKEFDSRVIIRCDYFYTNENGLGGHGSYDYRILVSGEDSGNGSSSSDSFWLVETIMEVEIGKYKQLHYNFYNNDSAPITWSSDNSSIAKVNDSGMVTGISKGTTYVRANTTNGRSASCKITVIDQHQWSDGDEFIVSPYGLPNLRCQIISIEDKTCRLGAFRNGGIYNGLYGGSGFYDKVLNLPSTVKTYDGISFKIIEVALLDSDLYPSIETVVLPNSILKLDNNCFGGAKRLKKVILPEFLSEIPAKAFCGCNSLTYVEIPDFVYSIGAEAFAATDLKTFSVSENSRLTTIDNGAFLGCSSLEKVDFGKNITDIGNEDSQNGKSVFRNTYNLQEIILRGKSVCNAYNLFGESGVNSDVTISVPEVALQDYSMHPYWKFFDKLFSIEHGDEDDYILTYSTDEKLFRTYRIFKNRNADGLVYSRKGVEILSSQYFDFFVSSIDKFFGAPDNNVIFSTSDDIVNENGKVYHKLKIEYDGRRFELDKSLDKCLVDITINLDELSIVFSTEDNNLSGIHDCILDKDDSEYYNLQGIKVENPNNGVFIKIQNGKAKKIIL